MIYFDSAYIAKHYLAEPESERVRRLAEAEGRVCCSTIGRVETAQVFHRKLREGHATRAETSALFDQFAADCALGLWTWLPLTDEFAVLASSAFRELSPRVAHRSADAIHLVTARQHGLSAIHTNDARMRAAASEFELKGRSV